MDEFNFIDKFRHTRVKNTIEKKEKGLYIDFPLGRLFDLCEFDLDIRQIGL